MPDAVKVEWLTVAGDADTWRSIGLTVTDDGLIPLIGTSIRVVPGADGGSGVIGWTLSGEGLDGDPEFDVDGLRTGVVDAADPTFAADQLGVSSLDHVVVTTPDLERTSTAIAEATGCDLKRIRDLGAMRQGFHRIGRGGLIVELVERPDVPPGPASFWGLVLIVDDIDAACALIGDDRVSPPKNAVSPVAGSPRCATRSVSDSRSP